MADNLSTDDTTGATTVSLDGVPETMLWPLWNRAFEAQRSDRLIDDPWSIDLVRSIDYDFEASFGRPSSGHGIRARFGDDLVRDFLGRWSGKAMVVALGEGLETQYWRLGEPDVPWLSVDLPGSIDVRQRLLPKAGSMSFRPVSALDDAWMDDIPEDRVPFISAMGLLMYFTEAEVVGLLTRIAARFAQAEVFFDAIPTWFSNKTMDGFQLTKHYRAPPMPWGISHDDVPAFIRSIPRLEPVQVLTYADPYPSRMRFFRLLGKISAIRRRFAPSLVHVRVDPPSP
ncbi:MAG: class I SAM-dependent methyltransferase [Myxococcota bacterium]